MKITVISHFYNESFLLPYWLKHHTRLFNHGILINHGSTDDSVDIIKKHAPNWSIVHTKNKDFHAGNLDKEVMEIESGIDGWKIALNTTEFLLHYDLHSYLRDREEIAISGNGIIMVDKLEERYKSVSNNDLFLQRHNGYFESDINRKSRSRIIHRANHGRYYIGRHHSELPVVNDPNLFVLWFGWCPFELSKPRKLQIQQRLPKDQTLVKAWHLDHVQTEESLTEWYLKEEQISYNLLDKSPEYKQALKKMCEVYNLKAEFPLD